MSNELQIQQFVLDEENIEIACMLIMNLGEPHSCVKGVEFAGKTYIGGIPDEVLDNIFLGDELFFLVEVSEVPEDFDFESIEGIEYTEEIYDNEI